ncbi:type II toxin-antitoxin system HipA family toxin [Amnibacterium kyonggiense]|uniref:Serine/threonine-protein kinase HipA n=1 Tax=Amnibacterium kyonggiense TaxID=595671 RepID=A0A4R7FJA8_9MICO|nr:HipA domain-containing protein [Amnibacterium kyonggiense]TDS76056.1 serine/threonine-protein kinase HipA [Amnibacterium kyonggiense]
MQRVYVWTWLPGATTPVVAGAIEPRNGVSAFFYARSYLRRTDAISLWAPELPLREGWIEPLDGLVLAGALRDGAPDAWGRRVIEAKLGVDDSALEELDYLLLSGSNRFGALDFQAAGNTYVPRGDTASLDELTEAATRLQEHRALSAPLEAALLHGTTIGGARPKVLVEDGDDHWIAKLASTSDVVYSVVGAEAAAMRLARAAGLNVADTRLATSNGRDVLLVRRFDRDAGGRRRHTVSALTMVGLDEQVARYATYPDVLDVLRRLGADYAADAAELFRRIAFSIAISNSDDHARNHAAFWDGRTVRLTPAYDLAPGNRSGETATQAMAYDRDGRRTSNFAELLGAASLYGLTRRGAREIIDRIIAAIHDGWDEAADAARLSAADRTRLWGNQFLNPGALHDY